MAYNEQSAKIITSLIVSIFDEILKANDNGEEKYIADLNELNAFCDNKSMLHQVRCLICNEIQTMVHQVKGDWNIANYYKADSSLLFFDWSKESIAFSKYVLENKN